MEELLAAGEEWELTGIGSALKEHYAEALSAEEKTAWADSISTKLEEAQNFANPDKAKAL
jgi:hypothetical protein